MRDFLEQVGVKDYPDNMDNNQLGAAIVKSGEVPTSFKVKGYDFSIVAGLLGNRDLIAKALGTTKDQIISIITEKLKSPKKYNIVNTTDFLQNKIDVDSNTDLEKYLPVIDYYKGKKYTTSSIVTVKFPDENRQNASFHRMMYIGKNKFSIRVVAQRHLDKTYTDAMEKGEDLKVAIVFGVHPAVELASAFSYPGLDEFELASAFLGGLDVFKLPNGIMVPAGAEFVMEGRITKQMAEEGPFIDLTGTADRLRQQPIVEIDRIYFRNKPLFRTLLPGGSEHRMLMGIPQEPRMFAAISNTIPTVKNVVLTPGGCSWLHAVVQIKKRTEGDAKNAIMAALAAHPSLKRVVIVDEDIDPSDLNDVEWAIATRVQPDRDLHLVPGAKGSSLDPSAEKSITCKWGIDATKPLKNNEGYNKVEF
jgi:UbiD family decarboxylase